jgi:predicted RNase H-like HicB family nuclease
VAQVKTYTVNAVPAEGWWGLTVPDAPGAVSQVRSLSSAEEYVREAISFVTGATPDSFAVVVVPQLPDDLAEHVSQAKRAAAEAVAAQADAAALARGVVSELAAAGFNGRETAAILGVSKQRVSQLAASAPRTEAADLPHTGRRRRAPSQRVSQP